MNQLQDLVTGAAGSPWVYFALLGVCIVDAFFPPVPSESVIAALAAIGSSTGKPSVWLLILAAAVGAIIGDNLAYTIGRAIGTDRFAWMRKPKIRRAFDWARGMLDKRAALLVITGRYIPVGRIAVNMTAGATRIPSPEIRAADGDRWCQLGGVFGGDRQCVRALAARSATPGRRDRHRLRDRPRLPRRPDRAVLLSEHG
ncbi:DedA family protein [Nocardia nova]|uniref:DedA family protein n=1 Tax=Nocardia nova TaxID=37330 RepID=UPI001C454084|nr:DedA family protein [Nocardia nova]MBV7708014.1 DedA family protein [Nocardia nova]